MDKLLQRVVSLLLTVAMLFSFVPGTVFAESGAESEIHKLTSADELVNGQYVLLCENGQAVGVLDGTWLTAAGTDEVAILSGPDAALVWTLDVNSDGVSLTDSNGVTVAPKGGNTNGIQAGDYRWAVTFENGAFQFSGVGEDTTRLASNTGSDNKFRAYKNDTINENPNGYPSNFTLYQVPAGSVTPEPDPETPVSITIAEALAAPSGTADLRVTGVVTLVDGQNIYLQDTTGASCARGTADGIALGDTVTATGTRGDYNGLPQLNNATFEKGEGMMLEAKTTTIDALTTADICSYVKLEHLTVTEVYDNNGVYAQPNITVTDGTNTIQIYKAVVDKQQDGSWAVAVDDTITVSAAVSVHNTTLQLRNTNANEIVKESGQPVEPQGPIADGDRVVIYNPAYNKALSATYNGFYNNGTDVTLSDGQLTGFSEADVWTVKDNGDGSFSFAYNGQNIGMGDSFSSMPLGEKNDRWVLEEASDGLYYIKNTVRNSYMEWYADKNNWNSYGKIGAGSEGLFALAFYKVTGEIPDPEPGQGALEDGDQVVIYNLSAKGVLAGPDGNETSPSLLSAPATEAETITEISNGEGAIGSGGYFPSYQYYTMALDKGWHVAPTNNQDNHKGKWGNANDARDVILADALTEESIYEAIRAYRVYASEDKNLEISYTLNDQVMGSIIEEVPETVEIDVSVYDPNTSDSISKVEVVVNSGTVAHSWTPAEIASGTMECAIPADYSYYFIRVTQGDGDVAVTAPVWVGETMKLGVSSVECGTATPVTGEALTLTTSLFNSELSAATIKSVTYSCDGQVLDTQKDLGTLDASSTKEVKWDYTPTVARVMTITVAVELEVDGISYTYTKDISLDVQDASKLVYIGIDASHYNEYVAGNYKDSMGNFGALAADYSVRTVQLNTSEQLLEACANEGGKYKALILTAPSRRDGNALRDPYATYSDEEIQAIQKFNAAGGVVVLAGWSDYYESYAAFDAADHMAAQQNKVLEALGSSLRIGDDATNDDTLNGGQTQRLYFSTYNWDSFLMDGVEYDAEHPNDNMYSQLFSQYGGASVYVVDENGNPTSELPATVSPVVYGHATTYSTDSDKDGLGGEAMPKYPVAEGDNRLMVLASEQLEGKGMILVSGAAFMSNFEVQAEVEDSASEKNYSNYNICANLVSSLNPVEISSIAQVQAEELEGVKFTIEGVVTSNASGYDKNTAFFDCIYLQDDTAGVNAFPVAGNYKVGDVVRITGTTSSYQGERQINVMQIEKIGEQSAPAPKQITASQLNDGSVLGSLVTLKGTVESFAKENGLVQTIMVKDAAGNLGRVFIDGYIDTAEDVKDLEEGCEITVTGLASYDNTFNAPEGPFPRIRVRDRSDVICTASQQPETSPKPEETPKPGTDLALDIQQGIVNVPESLKNTAFNTAEKIKNELYRVAATVLSGLKAENMLVYDITLMTRNALGQWVPVNPANFPKDGVVVELPYPAGTSRDTHDFVVTHMFTEERDGHKPGDVETMQVYETETGIRFVVKSLSPIGLSWKVTEKADGGQGSGGSTNAPAATPVPVITGGAQTGDSNVMLVAGAVVVLAVAALAALEISRRTRNVQQNKTK